jgi:hypothetical protein
LLLSKIPEHPTKVVEYFLGPDPSQLIATYTLQADGTVTCDSDKPNDFMTVGAWDSDTDTMVLPSVGEEFLKTLFLMQRVNCSMVEFRIS